MIKLLFFVLMYSLSQANAACDAMQITNIPSSINLNSNISPRVDFNITRSRDNGNCRYRVGIDRGSSTSYSRKIYNGPYQLDIRFSQSSNFNSILKDPVDANNSAEYIENLMRNNDGNDQVHFFSELTLDQNQPSGRYSDIFLVKLYERNGNNLTLKDTHNIEFYYGIPDQVSLSLVNTNAPFDANDTTQDINFGSLYSGATKKMDVVIQSNSGYKIDIASTNNGKIKHIGHSSTIDYLFKANGQAKDLSSSSSSPVTIATGNGNHPNDGFRVPLEFVIQSTENKVSGEYRDYLTITVTSNL